MKPAVIITCPHPPETVRIANVHFWHIDPPGWTIRPVIPRPDAIGTAIHRWREQGWVWDVRCTHRDHLADDPDGGGLTAQLSAVTLRKLVEATNLKDQVEPLDMPLPVLVRMLGRLGR
jgi:hypothetical protein